MSDCPTSTMRSLEYTRAEDWVVIYRTDCEDRSAFTERSLLTVLLLNFITTHFIWLYNVGVKQVVK